jgi:hypothetical protein
MPPACERVPGEIGLYQERGDVLFHHADVWHGGARSDVGHGTGDFVMNAAR